MSQKATAVELITQRGAQLGSAFPCIASFCEYIRVCVCVCSSPLKRPLVSEETIVFPPLPSNHHQGQRSIVAEAEHLNCLLPVSTFQNCTVILQSGVSALERERERERPPCSKLDGYEKWGGG